MWLAICLILILLIPLILSSTILSSTTKSNNNLNPMAAHHATAHMPSFLARLMRPFSTTATSALAIHSTSESAGGTSTFPENAQKCTVAAGCFWGVEHLFRRQFPVSAGLLDTKVGYIGGDTTNPGYRAVCSGRTGHAEALQMVFDPAKISYASLIEFFYKMHDPTTKDRQGGDRGTQYRSAIFFHGEEQERAAKEITDKVQKQWWRQGTITTQIVPAGQWWNAEEYHQLYLDNNPGGYECPAHYIRKFPDLQ